jgi:hypothetical protein
VRPCDGVLSQYDPIQPTLMAAVTREHGCGMPIPPLSDTPVGHWVPASQPTWPPESGSMLSLQDAPKNGPPSLKVESAKCLEQRPSQYCRASRNSSTIRTSGGAYLEHRRAPVVPFMAQPRLGLPRGVGIRMIGIILVGIPIQRRLPSGTGTTQGNGPIVGVLADGGIGSDAPG